MTPPDSGEREVTGSENCQGCAGMTLTHSRHCPRGEYGDWISLRKDLAQRILAALEEPTGQGRRRGAIADGILAAELRAVMPK